MVKSILSFIAFLSLLLPAKQYNVVEYNKVAVNDDLTLILNNDLDLIEDFTFQDFYDIQDVGAGAGTYGKLFSGGIYSDNFYWVDIDNLDFFKGVY